MIEAEGTRQGTSEEAMMAWC